MSMTKKVAVILSGCGVYDGAEIHESVITLLRLDQRGAQVQCFAPNIAQMHVINHLTGEEMPESRNVLVESARIARGEVTDIREARAEDFDALIVPGGFGAAKNLSNFAVEGVACTVQPDVLALAEAFAEAGKPVGLICISPALAAKIYGPGVLCTIGNDADTAAAVEKMGGIHEACDVHDIVEDTDRKLVTTPAYMVAKSISEAAGGIYKLVDRVLELTHEGEQ
jgi:enhancing lycopene biosynthesis protein 2